MSPLYAERSRDRCCEGKRLLEQAIDERQDYAFETTLGGNTIPALLEAALSKGIEVHIWYVGLDSPEHHIARVCSRVARGGHDIPEAKIRERYVRSIESLLRLLPQLTELRLYDNSHEADPNTGKPPEPQLILHLLHRKVVSLCEPIPEWARTIVSEARGMCSEDESLTPNAVFSDEH